MSDFISQLKAATAPMHKTVEGANLSVAIMSPNVNTSSYINYLCAVKSMHSNIETVIFPLLENIITNIDLRKKTGAILQDLKSLNAENVAELPVSFLDKDFKREPNFALGVMYVAEGSVLGGQFIYKNIKKALGENIAGNFFNIYGEQTGSTWKNFLADFDRHQLSLTEEGKKEIINGATYGFERASAIFNTTLQTL